MQIDERTKFMKLFDEYGKLLSEKQYEVMDKFLNLDIGESEMAELENLSRQSVHDAISKAKKQLLEMEKKCGFVRFKQELVRDLSKCLEINDDKLKEELAKIITKI